MKKTFFALMVALCFLIPALADEGNNFMRGDVDQDGRVTISDVTALIDYLLSGKWPASSVEPEVFIVNGVSFTMIPVEGGTFMLGATEEQINSGLSSSNELPAHEVTLSDFSIGQTEVTQELWQAVMGSNPSYFTSANGYTDDLSRPVESVSWDMCQEFITKLNEMTGKTFRLPSEAEWEYAARGGNKSHGYLYSGSDNLDEVAWYIANSLTPQSVATMAPNELDLYDMSGNVAEWCFDWYINYSTEAQTDPCGFESGNRRVTRGGGCSDPNSLCRVSCRWNTSPYSITRSTGLRLVLGNPLVYYTTTPVVATEMTDDALIVTATGNGVVTLYINGEEVSNPYIVTRSDEGYSITAYATAQEPDKKMSQCEEQTIVVPALAVIENSTFTVNGVSFNMMRVDGGTFTMGASDDDEEANSNERPAHEVTLSSYIIGETEVTQELWVAVMGENPSYYTGDLNRPIENVTWNEIQTFITKLNELTGQLFRLPTEAEWEFAARGGLQSHGYKYAGSNTIDDVAWYNTGNSDLMTHPVAQKQPNELGLYDMSGNVMEYCHDLNGNYSSEPQVNPTGPESGSQVGPVPPMPGFDNRVCRGGNYGWGANYCRVSFRYMDNYLVFRYPGVGFRLALGIPIN